MSKELKHCIGCPLNEGISPDTIISGCPASCKNMAGWIEEHDEEVRAEYREIILEFVKTPAFYDSWVNAKGERFGDFLAKQLEGIDDNRI